MGLVGTYLAWHPCCRPQLHRLRGKRSMGCVDIAKYTGMQAHNNENTPVILRYRSFFLFNKKYKQKHIYPRWVDMHIYKCTHKII